MKSSRRQPIIVCNCSSPHGTPLIVDRPDMHLVSNDESHRCLLRNEKVSNDGIRLTGNCPKCNRFSEIRLQEKHNVFDVPPGITSISSTQNLYWELTGSIKPDIAFMSPNLRFIAVEQRRVRKETVELPSRIGWQKLRVDTLGKSDFVLMMRVNSAECEDGITYPFMPDWYPGGTEEQFEKWSDDADYVSMVFPYICDGTFSATRPKEETGETADNYWQWVQSNLAAIEEYIAELEPHTTDKTLPAAREAHPVNSVSGLRKKRN